MTHNQIIEQSVDYIERISRALPEDTRYTVRYEGFGTGSTSGVTKAGALRYLYDLRADAARDYRRYRVELRSVSVTPAVQPAVFTSATV